MTQNMNLNITRTVYGEGDALYASLSTKAIAEKQSFLPFLKSRRIAIRGELSVMFDRLILENTKMRAYRSEINQVILVSDDILITGRGIQKSTYSSCAFSIFASSPELAQKAHDMIGALTQDIVILDPMFSINWYFLTGRNELNSVTIEEMADDILLDEAYPSLEGGVPNFISNYLDADETILVLQGPPGTGKTRLIRAILGEMSKRKMTKQITHQHHDFDDPETGYHHAQALYTGDKKSLENDELFVRFVTGYEDAFIMEDADQALKPRNNGNDNLHRFLMIADGVVRAQGRKIIFSTNLPNIGDLDDALIRPGRCFGRISLPELSNSQATALLSKLAGGSLTDEQWGKALAKLFVAGRKTFSLADVYQAIREAKK